MNLIQLVLHNFFSFVAIISLIVFIHEFGHFLVARLCSVKIDEFAIGFGKRLCGFVDKHGTAWNLRLLPFGGYVKMYGDRNGASMPDHEVIAAMSAEEKKKSFACKNVWQRMAIVAAGPVANFILAVAIFTILFRLNGVNKVLPIIDEVLPQSAAFEAGLKKGDEILAIDGSKIADFNEIRERIAGASVHEMLFRIKRGEDISEIAILPKMQLRRDLFGDEVKMATLGISSSAVSHRDLNLAESFGEANRETYRISVAIFKVIGELISGRRSVEELGGPIKIAKYSGKTVDMGFIALLWFVAMISINLGAMNLLPIPLLDGGHLFFYAIEAIYRKPLSQKVQQIGFGIGLSLVLALMIFTTVNDIKSLLPH